MKPALIAYSCYIRICFEKISVLYSVSGHLKWRNCPEDLDIDGRMILIWILKKWDLSMWTEFSLFGIGTSADSYKQSNGSSVSIIWGTVNSQYCPCCVELLILFFFVFFTLLTLVNIWTRTSKWIAIKMEIPYCEQSEGVQLLKSIHLLSSQNPTFHWIYRHHQSLLFNSTIITCRKHTTRISISICIDSSI
jgi:hypothetical protein